MTTAPSQWEMTRRGKVIFIPIFAVAMINFFVFITTAIYLGGDALSGYARDGHYFLGSHGAYTEVSRTVWRYSYFHAMSATITHFLMFATAAVLVELGDMKA